MNDEWSENLTLYFQRLLPLLFSLLLLFVSYIPLDLPISNNIRPAVGMICTYFWLLHRPDVFNLLSVYLLGLTEDVISSAPFGSNICAAGFVCAGNESFPFFQCQAVCHYLVWFCVAVAGYFSEPLAAGFGLLQSFSAAGDGYVQLSGYGGGLSDFESDKRFCAEPADDGRGVR